MQRVFYYQARDPAGKLFTGEIQAVSREAAAANIQLNGYFITKLQERSHSAFYAKFRQYFVNSNKCYMALLFRQLALLLQAGLPLLQCIAALQQEAVNRQQKRVLSRFSDLLQGGASLSQAMQSQPQYFSRFVVCLIEVGENSGRLDEILQRLANHLAAEFRQREKLKSALAYPIFVLLFAIGVLMVLVLYVLPVFADLFASMRLSLPLPTQILLKFTGAVEIYGSWLLLILTVVMGFGSYCWQNERWRKVIDRLIIRLPVIGDLVFKIEAIYFARVLSIMLESGVPVLTALAFTTRLGNNRYIGDLWQCVLNDIQQGISFTEALKKIPVPAALLVQMAAVGERTGKLEFMLDKAATLYEETVNEKLRRFGVLLEPCLTIGLGLVVGGIVLSIALPIFESITQAIS